MANFKCPECGKDITGFVEQSGREWLKHRVSKYTSDALRQKKVRGEAFNHPPYGWDVKKGKLIENPQEQAVIKDIKAMRDTGKPLQAIADALNLSSTPTKQGKLWHPTQVKNVLEFKTGAEVI